MIVIAAVVLSLDIEKELGRTPECETANQNCEGETHETCYSCGQATCPGKGCSSVIDYYGYGEQRVCLHCLEDRWEDTPALRKGLWQILFDQCHGHGLPKKASKVQADSWFKESTGESYVNA